METTVDLSQEHKQVRQAVGYFVLDDWALIGLEGKDAYSFLQSQTTNDCLKLEAGEGCPNAVVSRKGNLLATFSIYKVEDKQGFLLVEEHQKDKLIETLETYHFREDISFDPAPPDNCLIALQGPKSPFVLERLTGTYHHPFKPHAIRSISIEDQKLWVIEKSLTAEEGFVFALPPDFKEKFLELLTEAGADLGLTRVGPETREVLRIEAGLPIFGRDMDEKVLLPETGLEHSAVSYHKGCYTGQEVIARLKTYGAPSFALMGIFPEGDSLPPHNAEIKLGNKKIGIVKSNAFSPSLSRNVALAYIQKDFRSPDQTLDVSIDGKECKITTALLPFVQPESNLDRAKQLHHQAMTLFKDQDNLEEPIKLLREAIAIAPKFALAYEALGVLLSKQNKLDEAISLMKRLAEIDPTEIMAHSNLSIYYMEQGRIEDAELEKAEATAIQFEKLVEESQQKKNKEAQAKVQEAERVRQIDMFQQVLGIDPVDQVANFGLGSIFHEQGKFEEALPLLQTVVENYKDYSAAYLLLGKTYQKMNQLEEAAEVFRKGIAAASKKGDLMPLRDMQNRLNQIEQTGS